MRYIEKIKKFLEKKDITFEQAKLIFESIKETEAVFSGMEKSIDEERQSKEKKIWVLLGGWTLLLILTVSILVGFSLFEKPREENFLGLKDFDFASIYMAKEDYAGAIAQIEGTVADHPDSLIGNILLSMNYKILYLQTKEDQYLQKYQLYQKRAVQSVVNSEHKSGEEHTGFSVLLILFFLIVSLLCFAMIFLGIVLLNKEEKINRLWGKIVRCLYKELSLIPALNEAVKGYADKETQIFKNIEAAIDKTKSLLTETGGLTPIEDPEMVAQIIGNTSILSFGIKDLCLFIERFPKIRRDKNYEIIHQELLYNRKGFSRLIDDYNAKIGSYNNLIFKRGIDFAAQYFGFSEKIFINNEEEDCWR